MPEYTFSRYLAAKKSVDDRALNCHVWNTLSQTLNSQASSAPLRILEIGAGIGTMLERIHDWHLTPRHIHYTGLDSMPENIEAAHQRLALLPVQYTITLETINLFDFIRRESGNQTCGIL